jgi:hypothetical protein
METAEEQVMSEQVSDSRQSVLTQLSLSLGQVRAEYSTDEAVFSMFSWPVYWGKLVGLRPCVLVGGRGTGKTTTLRGLSYGGQFSLRGRELTEWDAIGAYWRIDSMVVSAFWGRSLDESIWISVYSHYVNLKMISLFLSFCEWRRTELGSETDISEEAIELSAISLHIPAASNLRELGRGVRVGLARLEATLNGATHDLLETNFSLLGRPLAYLLAGLAATDDIARLPFTFCIDEFENLRPYQQRVMNTLVKHVGDSAYTIKVGIRDTESRERDTLAINQPLLDPADYTTVDIVDHLKDQSFSKFASQVCEMRLSGTALSGIQMSTSFPSLSTEAEAELLGAVRERARIRQRLVKEQASEGALADYDSMPLLGACLVGYWSKAQSQSVVESLEEARSNDRAWKERVGNHSYAMLFTFRQGLRGVRKYYSGWSTYCQLANGNIRLLLELVYEALRAHISEVEGFVEPVSHQIQSEAASSVGQTTLRELQGLSGRGGQLTRLTLSLGRIFQVFAATPEGHTPEVNQLRIETDSLIAQPSDLESLLQEAVANGCLIAFPGDKQERDSAQTKSFDYQLHPIFAAYFTYSHRKKRRIQLGGDQVLALSGENAARAIAGVLSQRRNDLPVLPQQLELYSDFYNVPR